MEPIAESVLSIVSEVTRVPVYDIDSRSRVQEVHFARTIFYKLMHETYGWGVTRISRAMGRHWGAVRSALDGFAHFPGNWKECFRQARDHCLKLHPPHPEALEVPEVLTTLGDLAPALDRFDLEMLRCIASRVKDRMAF